LGKFFQQKIISILIRFDKINLRLENLKTKSLGLRYSEYKTIDSELSKLSKEITISRQINEDYLEMKCDDYILSNIIILMLLQSILKNIGKTNLTN
jgi:hypothetical protein